MRSRYAIGGAVVLVLMSALGAAGASANVLLIGTSRGIAGKYNSIGADCHAAAADQLPTMPNPCADVPKNPCCP